VEKADRAEYPVLAFFFVVAISQISPPRPDKGNKFRQADKKKAAQFTLLLHDLLKS
jgi:hypothetical protein